MASTKKIVESGPPSLKSQRLDITGRLGELPPASPTGLKVLDRLLGGGLRRGQLLCVSGFPGSGKTAIALHLAYMAARTNASVLLASVSLDEAEVVARLAARALFRRQEQEPVTYGEIYDGQAWQKADQHSQVSASVATVMEKVGEQLHTLNLPAMSSTETVRRQMRHLWSRSKRAVLVVDDLAALTSEHRSDLRGQERVAQVAQELLDLARTGCAVVATTGPDTQAAAFAGATVGAELRRVEGRLGRIDNRLLALGLRPVDLTVVKNRIGPTGTVPLRFIAGAATFEERAP